MPELYRDLLTCVVCDKGGDCIKQCAKCFSVAYCGRECQVGDWARHKRLCVPVMVKDFGEKGRGLVASRDFKIGDIIMKDKAVVTSSAEVDMYPPDVMDCGNNISWQLLQLPDDIRAEYFQLSPSKLVFNKFEDPLFKSIPIPAVSKLAVAIFLNNRIGNKIYLSLSLINHSCDPNAGWQNTDESYENEELRATRDIKKGEEITSSYLSNFEALTNNKVKRQEKLQSSWSFVCKCEKCEDCEDESFASLKREIEKLLPSKRPPTNLAGWKSHAKSHERLVDAILTILGKPSPDFYFDFKTLASFGQLARNPNLVDKGMKLFLESVDIGQFSFHKKEYETHKKKLLNWKRNLSSRKSPDMDEVTTFL